MRRGWVGVVALVAAWVFSVAAYPSLPGRVTIRWNLEFEPAGTAPRVVAAVVIPSLLLLVPLLAAGLARIDPRQDSYRRHRPTYWLVWSVVMVLLAGLQVLTIGTGLGWEVDTARIFAVLIGGFFVVMGNQLSRLRPNWFLGVRTPWTLHSDEVWRRTHRLAARTTVAAGLILIVAGLVRPEWVRGVSWIAALALVVAAPVVYSYIVWRRLGRPRADRAESPARTR